MSEDEKVVAIAKGQTPERNKGGRPPYRRDERTARQVEAMVGYGLPIAAIGMVIGVSENTLRKYYGDEIAVGATKANAKVIESLFRKATGDGQGAVTAAIFWAKTRCGWKETNVNEMSGLDGGPIRTETVSARERLATLIEGLSERQSDAARIGLCVSNDREP